MANVIDMLFVMKEIRKAEKNLLKKVFGVTKPLIGMLHLKGESDEDVVRRAKHEIDLFINNGVNGLVVENYFGNYYQMRMVLEYLSNRYPDFPYGVNSLNFDSLGFDLAREFNAKFVQLDSVVGHIKPRDEASMEAFMHQQRSKSEFVVFGGVRFKYQPVLSEKTVEEDLIIAKDRCDAVVVTGNATGEETAIDKIKLFRQTLGNFPLIIGAGLTPNNAREQLRYADGAIVGSYFKDGHNDSGEVNQEYIRKLVKTFEEIRKENH